MMLSFSTLQLLASLGDSEAADAIECANTFSTFVHNNGMIFIFI